MRQAFFVLALASMAVASDCAQAAGRLPNTDERAAIEDALKAAGYTSWGKIDLDDDGYWEVDDAIGADGKNYDVDLDLKTLKVLRAEIDAD